MNRVASIASAALASRGTRPGRGRRARAAPAPSPSKRTWPFSRNTARSAIASATLSDCSTMTIVMPSAFSRSTTWSSSWTTIGDRPSESSSMSSTSGSWSSTHGEGQHLLLAARQRAARPGPGGSARSANRSSTLAMRRSWSSLVAAVDERRHLEVLADRHLREHALAAGQQADAHASPLLGRDVGDGLAVEAHDAAGRRAEAGDDPQDGRLAGAVGAEQGQHLALAHLEADVEEHLHLAVGEVDVGDLEGRDRRRGRPSGAGAPPSPPGARRRPATGRS